MIRKLRSGKYRLYSRKNDEKTANGGIWGRLRRLGRPRSMGGRCSILNGIEGGETRLCVDKPILLGY